MPAVKLLTWDETVLGASLLGIFQEWEKHRLKPWDFSLTGPGSGLTQGKVLNADDFPQTTSQQDALQGGSRLLAKQMGEPQITVTCCTSQPVFHWMWKPPRPFCGLPQGSRRLQAAHSTLAPSSPFCT